MILYEKIPMTSEGMAFEIRVLYDSDTINVAAFRNNYPVNGFRYQIKIPKKCSVKAILGKGAAAELVEMSKNDVIQKRWDGLSEIINNCKQDD